MSEKYTSDMLPSEPVCYTCPYFGETNSGEHCCRRHPPRPVMLHDDPPKSGMVEWPEVCEMIAQPA